MDRIICIWNAIPINLIENLTCKSLKFVYFRKQFDKTYFWLTGEIFIPLKDQSAAVSALQYKYRATGGVSPTRAYSSARRDQQTMIQKGASAGKGLAWGDKTMAPKGAMKFKEGLLTGNST